MNSMTIQKIPGCKVQGRPAAGGERHEAQVSDAVAKDGKAVLMPRRFFKKDSYRRLQSKTS
jgi:hypothetical protein